MQGREEIRVMKDGGGGGRKKDFWPKFLPLLQVNMLNIEIFRKFSYWCFGHNSNTKHHHFKAYFSD